MWHKWKSFLVDKLRGKFGEIWARILFIGPHQRVFIATICRIISKKFSCEEKHCAIPTFIAPIFLPLDSSTTCKISQVFLPFLLTQLCNQKPWFEFIWKWKILEMRKDGNDEARAIKSQGKGSTKILSWAWDPNESKTFQTQKTKMIFPHFMWMFHVLRISFSVSSVCRKSGKCKAKFPKYS